MSGVSEQVRSSVQEASSKKTVGDYLSAGKLEMGLMRVEQVHDLL